MPLEYGPKKPYEDPFDPDADESDEEEFGEEDFAPYSFMYENNILPAPKKASSRKSVKKKTENQRKIKNQREKP